MFKGNKIYKIDKNGRKRRIYWVKGLNIKFKGRNSTVILHEPIPRMKKCKIVCGNNNIIEIDKSNHKVKRLLIWCQGDNNTCKIGENFSCTDLCNIMLQAEANISVEVGDDCMFATNVRLRTTDAHTIYNVENDEIQNFGKSINIGNHCWLALDSTVLKGVTIADNCVIGANSLVTKDCTAPNSIYAGLPAKMIRTGINWKREVPRKN